MRAQRLALGAAIGTKSHVSARRAVQLYLPLIQFLFQHDRSKFEKLGDWLEAKEELAGLLEAEQAVEANDSS